LRKRDSQDEHRAYSTNCWPQRDCKQLIVIVSYFWNSATKHPQMAAPNRGLVSWSFRATQTQVQVMYVTIYTWICRHELCSGVDLAASWKRPSLARAWASRCYVNFGCMRNASSLGDTRSYMCYDFSSVLLR
jgi:hypothetical protein